MATLTDVAAAAGVSTTTISRYLGGKMVLPPSTRARIDAAIVALDYRPNLLAKRLSKGRAEAIGLVTPEIGNPFFAQLASAVETEAERHGYAVYMSSTQGDPGRVMAAIRRMRDGHVDGLVLMTSRPDDDGSLSRHLTPHDKVILLDEDVPGTALCGIFAQNEQGAEAATRHLIDAGHRHIAFIGGPPGLMSVRERLAGYQRALAGAGLTARPQDVLLQDYSRAFGAEATRRILQSAPRPTAIFASSDYLAIGVIEAFHHAGLSLPQDMSLIGFDDMPFAELVSPPLTTIRQQVADMGRLAFRHLLALMTGQPVPAQTRLPVDLVLRKSVLPPS